MTDETNYIVLSFVYLRQFRFYGFRCFRGVDTRFINIAKCQPDYFPFFQRIAFAELVYQLTRLSVYKQSTMNNPFEEIFKRLENIEKMISPVGSSSSEEPDSRQSVLVKISVASRITGYSVNYLYHLASSGAIPYVKRGRSLRFDVNELQQWMQQQYIPASNKLSDERKKE